MPSSTSVAVQQLETLLREKLIPWAQQSAPLIWLGTPPRSALPLDIREEAKPPLPPVRAKADIQTAKRWHAERVNSVNVPILGCVYAGNVDYVVRAAPGQVGRQWHVPINSGSFFLIPPDTPFLDGSDPPPGTPYERAVLIYLRRDGIKCHSYTRDKGKTWLHPYLFVYAPDVWLPGERLFREMQRQSGPPDAVVYHYLSLILCLMLRGIREGNASTLKIPRDPMQVNATESAQHTLTPTPQDIVRLATEYIDQHLKDASLTIKEVAFHVGLSSGHLNRLFHQEKGETVFAYLQARRLKEAQTLLATSTFSIRLITYLCGFTNPSHFSHWFTRNAGCSPSEYRRQSPPNV